MKLGSDVLLEIVNIVQRGLIEDLDVSDLLRKIDVEESEDRTAVVLTANYKVETGRA